MRETIAAPRFSSDLRTSLSITPPRVGISAVSKPNSVSLAAVFATDGCSESVMIILLESKCRFFIPAPAIARLFASLPEPVNTASSPAGGISPPAAARSSFALESASSLAAATPAACDDEGLAYTAHASRTAAAAAGERAVVALLSR